MRTIGLGLLAAGLLLAPGDLRAQELRKDRARLQGDWLVLTAIKNGRQDTGRLTVYGIHIEGDSFSAEVGVAGAGRTYPVKGTFKLDVSDSKQPKQIEATLKDTSLEGNILKGIYAFDGHNLKLCLALPGSEDRPGHFASPPGSTNTFLTLGRLKKE